jgi:hypothetical protein
MIFQSAFEPEAFDKIIDPLDVVGALRQRAPGVDRRALGLVAVASACFWSSLICANACEEVGTTSMAVAAITSLSIISSAAQRSRLADQDWR